MNNSGFPCPLSAWNLKRNRHPPRRAPSAIDNKSHSLRRPRLARLGRLCERRRTEAHIRDCTRMSFRPKFPGVWPALEILVIPANPPRGPRRLPPTSHKFPPPYTSAYGRFFCFLSLPTRCVDLWGLFRLPTSSSFLTYRSSVVGSYCEKSDTRKASPGTSPGSSDPREFPVTPSTIR